MSRIPSHPTHVAHLTSSLTIIIPKKFDRPAGFGFVHFETEGGAKNAVEKLNNTGEFSVQLRV